MDSVWISYLGTSMYGGEDPEREGLGDTPERYARAMRYCTKEYEGNMSTRIWTH